MRLTLRAAISIGLLGLISSRVDWRLIPTYLEDANLLAMVGAMVLITLSRVLMPAKWRLLLTAKGINIRYPRLLKMYYTANFLGQVLPATVGTDLVRLHYATVNGASRTMVAASIVVERLLGVLALLIFASSGIAILTIGYSASVARDVWLTLLVASTVAGFGLLVSLTYSDWLLRLFKSLSRPGSQPPGRLSGRVWSTLMAVAEACLRYVHVPRALLSFFGLTLLECGILVSARYLVISAFVPGISLLYVISFAPVVIFLHRLPISFAGWGVYQAGFVYFLTQVGVDTGMALMIGIIDQLIVLITVLPGAGFYLHGNRIAESREEGHDPVS
jgi:uncharacterized protein (TIRG00374 family)